MAESGNKKSVMRGIRSLHLEDVSDGPAKARMIAIFKHAGFIENTCSCGAWYMCHPDDQNLSKCPRCILPQLNN